MIRRTFAAFAILLIIGAMQSDALERPDTEFRIFQFPRNMIPRIDGETDDWDMIPDEYTIGIDQLVDTRQAAAIDTNNFDVEVKVGWVKGLNRLYFLYKAYDNYWNIDDPGRHSELFEVVVDSDLSGGTLLGVNHPAGDLLTPLEKYFSFHGVHAQNYHIYTPNKDKSFALIWGCQPWITEFPRANSETSYDFGHGESGTLIQEFWITPYDYAPHDGPEHAVESKLVENTIIGLSWSILEYDDDPLPGGRSEAAWTLSHTFDMIGNASSLCAFRLMPVEKELREPVEADWDFKIVDMDRRLVAFKDRSFGNITSWKWDFGDGTTSTEQHPIHTYEKAGTTYVVILDVSGPDGAAKFSRVWDVQIY
jgi:hypothetical protein